MGALFTVSYWIVLVTVIPGLVTIAVIFGALAVVDPTLLEQFPIDPAGVGDWVAIAFAVTIMILTQAIGILLEELLVRMKWLGRKEISPEGIDRYEEYNRLYFLLAEMKKDDDAHGHLRRAITQFFLTMNTLVSFLVGIIVTLVIALIKKDQDGALLSRACIYAAILVGCLTVSYVVAIFRLREMAKSIWIARRESQAGAQQPPPPNNSLARALLKLVSGLRRFRAS